MTVRRERAERLADEELMPLIGEKDPEAFEVFYDRHGGQYIHQGPYPSQEKLEADIRRYASRG